ncbi:ATP-binding cassette domain-containing protein [Peterkaempfera bronchialis]|uniref:ATP-binding cassette domain-containing protein n=1 Tax=Peterkaempfera bronchialis TaxID=2126346 RepID=UPI002AFE46F0|nr:ATP-binding cassette domain-containing protein [Peterkaempfera bronchialis]
MTRVFRTRSGPVEAVSGVDLTVEDGEVVGFLGPNGAGKTTTVRMLCTLLKPTSGTATVAGHDVVRQRAEVRRRIGYVGQSGSGGEHRAGDELRTQAMLQGLDRAAATARAAELAEQFDLGELLERPCSKLSGGQRRRLDLALGLVHRPGLLFLDEPTAGLDPQARANLWDHLRTLRAEQGTTIFLTTHYLDEADALCDRILVIDGGRIVASDTSDALKNQIGGDVIILESDQIGDITAVATRVLPDCRPDSTVGSVHLHCADAQRRLPELLRALHEAGVELTSIAVKRPTLEDAFLRLTGRSLREEGRGAAPAEQAPQPDQAATGDAPAEPIHSEVAS